MNTMTFAVIALAVAAAVGTIGITMQEAYAHHTSDPNASPTGELNGGVEHGRGLSDHGCDVNSQGFERTGGDCKHQSLVE